MTEAEKLVGISLLLPESMAEAVKAKAKDSERTLSAEVRVALRQHLGDQEKAA